jgi:Ca-activated chloride channel family protein
MAEALGWPETPIGWDTIVTLAADPNGWATYGRPEWGQFRFGHTHPAYANSGLLSMTSFVYGIAGKTETLTPADVYATDVEEAMRTLEQHTSKYGRQAPALLELMAQEGPSYLHAAAVPEAEAVRFNVERGDELTFPLAFIFPAEGTIWADHPYCILDNADWVTPDQAEAAAVFRDYLLAQPQQEMAIDNYLRPLDGSIALHAPLDLANGTDPRVTPATIPALPSPSADVSAAVIDLFQITKRKASVLLVLDVSGSMEGDKIKTARTATVEFLQRLDANDEVGVMIFSDGTQVLQPLVRKGDVAETLAPRVEGLVANGNTALYQAVCEAVKLMASVQADGEAGGESRLYGIVLLSDGEDTVGTVTENQMFATCLPANAEADGIKVFPIAFGSDADEVVLSRLGSVSGGRMFTADPASISDVYLSISAEQ